VNDLAVELGKLGVRVENLENEKDSSNANHERRRGEISDMTERFNKVENRLQQVETALNGQAESMIGLSSEMHTTRDETVATREEVAKLSGLIEGMTQKSFNWSKFMSGLITAKGMILCALFITAFTTMFLAVVSPEHLPQFFDTVKAAKQ